MKKLILPLTLLVAIFSSPLIAEKAVYKVDPVHSGVAFKIRHAINKMPGLFNTFAGEIHFDAENPENSKAFGTVEIASVDTRDEKRDSHLQNEDFFNSPANPLIEFTSTKWTVTGENKFLVTGVMKMAGQENEIEINLEFLGEMEARGTIRSGWEGTAVIDRRDWGMTYGAPLVGHEVTIELNIQAHRQ